MTKHIVLIPAGRATFERYSEDIIRVDYWFPGLVWFGDTTFKLAGKMYEVMTNHFEYREVIAKVI